MCAKVQLRITSVLELPIDAHKLNQLTAHIDSNVNPLHPLLSPYSLLLPPILISTPHSTHFNDSNLTHQISWDITLAAHAAVTSRQALYAVRFLLGLLEVDEMAPGVVGVEVVSRVLFSLVSHGEEPRLEYHAD